MSYLVKHLINGQAQEGDSTQRLTIYNPAQGCPVGEVLVADEATINQAVAAAKKAFPSWSATPPAKRAQIFFRFKYLIEQHLDTLVHSITREHGKTRAEAKGDVMRGLELVESACHIADKLKGDYAANIATNLDGYSIRQPLGVCLGITPFNFPAMIPLWMLTTAVACGNTFILKPSEKDPSCPNQLVELLYEAGLPEGVVNVIQGDQSVVQRLVHHDEIAAVSFVGSTVAAEHVYQSAIAQGKRAQSFGGAKNHCVVMPDAELAFTVDAIVNAAFGCAGERCMALPVVVAVGDDVADKLAQALTQAILAQTVGPGDDEKTQVGPLITAEHCARVKSFVQIGIDEGATLRVDQREQSLPGFFCGPCFFDHVTPAMRIYQEEIFGPVLCLVRVDTMDQAIALINQHQYGNGTAIFTRDGESARQFVNQIQVGMVGVNVPVPVPAAMFPFGGWKQSKFGDAYLHGDEGLRFYTKTKSITQYWPDKKQSII